MQHQMGTSRPSWTADLQSAPFCILSNWQSLVGISVIDQNKKVTVDVKECG